MSILGVVLRAPASAVPELRAALAGCAGVDVAADPGDGRLVLVIEDSDTLTAAAQLGEISRWPAVWSTSLVYEYAGKDAPPPAGHLQADWRQGLDQLDRRTPAPRAA